MASPRIFVCRWVRWSVANNPGLRACQLQSIPVGKGADCRFAGFRLQVATITYTYKGNNLADWAKKPDVQAAFPFVKSILEGAGSMVRVTWTRFFTRTIEPPLPGATLLSVIVGLNGCYRAVIRECGPIVIKCGPKGPDILHECGPERGFVIEPGRLRYRAATTNYQLALR